MGRDDMWKDMADVIGRFNQLDNNTELEDLPRAWEEISELITQRGLEEVGGPFPEPYWIKDRRA